MTKTVKERLFSGVQPSGSLHVGNYLGAIRNWVELQKNYDCLFCIVDYHAITSRYDTSRMPNWTLEGAIDLIACGIDPEKSILFIQSHVPEHTELAWVLSSTTPMGDLGRMTQFKEKTEGQKMIPAGLFTYPILMTADILLYDALHVPVGDDQLQHLELSREIARRFNNHYNCTLFREPSPILAITPRIMGLDGKRKMSKSLGNYIAIRDSKDEIMRKLKPAFTDENRKRLSDPGNPGICNIFSLHRGFSPTEKTEEIEQNCRGAKIGCGECKKILAENMYKTLEPIQEKIRELDSDRTALKKILSESASMARRIATDKMQKVREILGLLEA